MIDKLVLGLEGAAHPRARVPEARVVRDLGPSHVLHRQVGHNVVHAREGLVARFPLKWSFGKSKGKYLKILIFM